MKIVSWSNWDLHGGINYFREEKANATKESWTRSNKLETQRKTRDPVGYQLSISVSKDESEINSLKSLISFNQPFFCFFLFETRSHYVALASMEFAM